MWKICQLTKTNKIKSLISNTVQKKINYSKDKFKKMINYPISWSPVKLDNQSLKSDLCNADPTEHTVGTLNSHLSDLKYLVNTYWGSKWSCCSQKTTTDNCTSNNWNNFKSKLYINFFAKLSSNCKFLIKESISNRIWDNLNRKSWSNLWKEVHKKLIDKYAYDRSGYDKIIISDIIKNKPTHMTTIFKEYLVFDEPIEFLKRNYSMKENKNKLNKLNDFHNTYFKVFPNYICIPEKYYMYKNIERKQRVIDDQQYRIMMKSNGAQENLLENSNKSNLFNESYMKHISTFRIKFNTEELKETLPKIITGLKLTKLSIWTSYIQESELIKQNDFKNSMELILSKVDTSVICSEK